MRAGRAFLQLLLRWVFGAPQSAALVPPKFTSGGYYLLINSMVSVIPSVRSQKWALSPRSNGLLTTITSMGFRRSPERSSGPIVAC